MLFVVSYFFLDLRFVITRADGDNPQSEWLAPRWIRTKSDRPQVGKLGFGVPIPSADRLIDDMRQHAWLDGGLALQTPQEYTRKRTLPDAVAEAFAIRSRAFVADEWGHVRFDIVLERKGAAYDDVKDLIGEMLSISLCAPLLDDGDDEDSPRETRLDEAAGALAQIYQRESMKTCLGYIRAAGQEDRIRQVSDATAGAVVPLCGAPHVTALFADEMRTRIPASCAYDGLGQGYAAPLMFDEPAPQADLCWGLWALSPFPNATLERSALEAAFGLCWLVGNLLEFVEFPQSVKGYEAKNAPLIDWLVRSARKRRNKRLGSQKAFGWPCTDMLKLAVAAMHQRKTPTQNWMNTLSDYATSDRDVGGVAGNVTFIIQGGLQMAKNIFSGTFRGSPVTVDSHFENVTQNIGAMAAASADDKDQLLSLANKLRDQLKTLAQAEPAKGEQIEAVVLSLDDLLGKTKTEKPNKTLLRSALDSVKTIAKGAAEAAPDVIATVGAIAGLVVKIFGL